MESGIRRCRREALTAISLRWARRAEEKAGIERLPGSLLEAAREFYKDPFIMSVLGEELSRKYIRAKTKEYAEYREQVTEWELEKYLHVI